MKRFFLLTLFTFACSVSIVGCGGGGDPEPLEKTEEDAQIEQDSASGMEDAMKKMGKTK